MLSKLIIKNYALIKELNLSFDEGLTAVTGETGSGKSIILGALGLVLGDRADLSTLSSQKEKCIIEAHFRIGKEQQDFFAQNDLDFDPHSIIRREITPAGKSRSFINDTPCNLQLLKSFGSRVLDIHSQLESSQLTDKTFQFELLDTLAKQTASAKRWQLDFQGWKTDRAALAVLKEEERKSLADLDYLRFQLSELEEVALETLSVKDLESELATNTHAEKIRQGLGNLHFALEEDDQPVVSTLQLLETQLRALSDISSEAGGLLERLSSSVIELKDIAQEASFLADSVEENPERASEIQALLDKVYHLQNKHRLQSSEELIALREDLRNQIENIDSLEDRIASLEEQVESKRKQLSEDALQLHSGRETAATELSNELQKGMQHLKLPDATLRFEVEPSEELNAHGASEVAIVFSANKGLPAMPLAKVASGGERSRVMLALKQVVAAHTSLPAMIFDEIDTGVSGEVAAKMADTMQKMSEHLQVIAITHLPQVAAKAAQHLKVSKQSESGRTETTAYFLSKGERLEELASMLSGTKITDAARSHAKDLLEEV